MVMYQKFNKNTMNKNYPQLYIFREKHGDRHCLVNSAEGELNMFLAIMKERFNDGWYEWYKNEKPYSEKPKFTQEDIDKMSSALEDQKKVLSQQLLKYQKEEKEAKRMNLLYDKLVDAINTNNGKFAKAFAYENNDGEYETFDSETPTIYE